MACDMRAPLAFEVRLISTAPLAESAELLDRLAEFTGDRAWARAANALRQQPGGRKPIAADEAAIAQVLDLMRGRPALSMREACRQVAKGFWPYKSPESCARRLSGKIAARKAARQ